MNKPVVYVLGAAIATAIGIVIFSGSSSAATNNNSGSCGGIDDLREPVKSQVKAALADPNATADQLNQLAALIDQIPCPAAAQVVRQAALTKAVSVNPPGPTPAPSPTPPARPDGCAPVVAQVVGMPSAGPLSDLAQSIAGNADRWGELVPGNPQIAGAQYIYQVTQNATDNVSGASSPFGTQVVTDRVVDSSNLAAFAAGASDLAAITGAQVLQYGVKSAGSGDGTVTYTAVTAVSLVRVQVPQGADINIPLSWNQFFAWSNANGDYEATGGVAHSPCPS